MKLDEKLDLIIELLREINQKLGGDLPTPKPDKVKVIRARKPTEEQLRNQRTVEWATKSDRRSFLKAWKRDLPKILEIQRHKPNFYPEFEPQTLKWFSKFRNPNVFSMNS
ncbi:hypothetical protein [Pedobacter sp. MC2016-24]|uniref:hypothetical protein n=1 Tax=Pedobacter sp. MC2016-24 TaxID=2780090 RepID=UPI0018816325|nr:hypothetical protein [Pedobacter sp. MC2016-24]MBE9599990.1 hypothetical protein [Pedobacter sp. MC2016-24]